MDAYVPTAVDEELLKEELGIMVARILCTYILPFSSLDPDFDIPHDFSKESCEKSEIVPLGILQKDETKTAEMIDILDHYSQYLAEDENGDPVPMLLYCDGLSCERVNSAQRGRINAGDRWSRLWAFEPSIQEWHRRLMYMQDTFDELFKFESQREKGTLYNIKQVFDHTGVSHNIMDCFNKAETLLEFSTESYVLAAALEVMGTKDLKDTPADFPITSEDQLDYIMNVSNTIVDVVYHRYNTNEIRHVVVDDSQDDSLFCICKLDIGGPMVYCANKKCERGQWFHFECVGMTDTDLPSDNWFCSLICRDSITSKKRRKKSTAENLGDGQHEYARKLIWRGLNDLARHDAVRHNDGNRMILHWKFDLMEFSEQNHPKYFIYAHRLLTNVHGGTSDYLKHMLIWNRTVNIRGGKGKNIPKDLYNEFLNKDYKENSRNAGGQLTEKTIARHSQMLGVGKTLQKVYHSEVAVKTAHLTRKSSSYDRHSQVVKLVEILKPLKLFKTKPGRFFKGLEGIVAAKGVTKSKQFKKRVNKHKESLALLREMQTVLHH